MSPIVKQKYPIKLRGTAMEEFKIGTVVKFRHYESIGRLSR